MKYKKQIITLLFTLFLAKAAVGSAYYIPRAIALGDGITAIAGSSLGEAFTSNPAGLVSGQTGCLAYYDNHFSISGYEIKGINFGISRDKLGLGFYYDTQGANLFENNGKPVTNFIGESQFGFGIAGKKNKFSFGANVWKYSQSYDFADGSEIKPIAIIGTDLGVQYSNINWGVGFAAKGLPLMKPEEYIEAKEYSFGLRYGKVDELFISLDLTTAQNTLGDFETSIHGGIEGWLLQNFAIRLGVDQAGMLTAGLGIKKGNFLFDYAFKPHPTGKTHYFATGYSF